MKDDITLLELLKTLDSEDFVRVLFKQNRGLCRSDIMDGGQEESWKMFCLKSEHRGIDGCYKCKSETLDMKVSDLQKLRNYNLEDF